MEHKQSIMSEGHDQIITDQITVFLLLEYSFHLVHFLYHIHFRIETHLQLKNSSFSSTLDLQTIAVCNLHKV